MTIEPKHPPDVLVAEAASLFHLLGGMGAKHLAIVGGMVPALLVPDASQLHIGSADVDLCLSVALTTGGTRKYYDSIQELIEPFFEPATHAGHRWRKKHEVAGIPLVVDFLSAADDDVATLADGTGLLEDDTAIANTGGQLRPFPIRAGRLIDDDLEAGVARGIALRYREGARADVDVRYAGPVGFLAAKADALDGRDETKDGYDVAWWCLNAAPTPQEVAALVTSRPAFQDKLFQEAVAELRRAFAEPDYPGPDGYARELLPDAAPGDADFEEARNRAFAATRPVIDELHKKLW